MLIDCEWILGAKKAGGSRVLVAEDRVSRPKDVGSLAAQLQLAISDESSAFQLSLQQLVVERSDQDVVANDDSSPSPNQTWTLIRVPFINFLRAALCCDFSSSAVTGFFGFPREWSS